MLTIRGGTLAETRDLEIAVHVWTSRKQNWVQLDSRIPQFETQPEDLKALRDEILKSQE